ncbi:hypothetical protein EVG20_g4592 [Dentipellis fragilis]|uniref:monoamine oxidase n=1 Tax=Dentipellis fragilis TaxID=205917 RepID=A0A4Y9YXU2_9AGAM|nr:hypothetical protein EVG20_g4592 [Dentipellis fragilis]
MTLKVAVIGGGIAGLYTALLLQREGHYVHVFEASERVGGRIYTYHFTDEKNQFFDAGAMVLPPTMAYNTVIKKLIDYVNTNPSLPADMTVTKLKEKMNYSGVRTLANGKINDWYSRGYLTPAMVGWPVPAGWENESVNDRMTWATGDFVEGLFRDFDATFSKLLPLDVQFGSFRSWIRTKRGNDEGWPDAFIDFVETILFETNAFDLSCAEIIVRQLYLVPSPGWSLIEGGMGRLPDAMAEVLGWDNITLGAYVKGLEPSENKVIVTAEGYNGEIKGTFGKVVVAVPPAALVMIADRPRWQPDKETALRAMNVESVYRMGMRFKTRWWDRRWVYSGSDGSDTMGEAVADIPVRLVMFPPVVDEQNLKDRPGTIVLSASGPDAQAWAPLTPTMRRSQAIHCLEKIINDRNIDILEELIDTFDVVWSNRSANGTTAFLPGQFERSLPAAKRAEGNIYFAGEHLSHHHGWIMGAAQSALDAVREVLNNADLVPLSKDDNKTTQGAGSTTRGSKAIQVPLRILSKRSPVPRWYRYPHQRVACASFGKGGQELGRGREFPGRAETCYLAGPYFEISYIFDAFRRSTIPFGAFMLLKSYAILDLTVLTTEHCMSSTTSDLESVFGVDLSEREMDNPAIFACLTREPVRGCSVAQCSYDAGVEIVNTTGSNITDLHCESPASKTGFRLWRRSSIGAAHNGATARQVALAWLLAQGEDVVTIPGTTKLKYLDDNLGASTVVLSAKGVAKIRQLAQDTYKTVTGEGYPPGQVDFLFVDTPPLWPHSASTNNRLE